LPAFQFRSSHSRLDSFDDQAAFQLGNRSDDYDHRTTQWPARVDVFSKADEFYAQAVQLIEDFQEMAHTPGYSVERGDENDVEAVPSGIGQKLVETGTPRFRAGNNIGVLVHDLVSALLRHLSEVEQLRFRMLSAVLTRA
jgi:hypothetical protein